VFALQTERGCAEPKGRPQREVALEPMRRMKAESPAKLPDRLPWTSSARWHSRTTTAELSL